MNIADESFPEILITDSSSSEDERAAGLMAKRNYSSSTSDVRTATARNINSRSKSTNELMGRRSSQYKNVPSKVGQYISSLPKPRAPGKRLVKQQTMPDMSQLRAVEEAESLRENLQEMKDKYEEMKSTNVQLQGKIQQMVCELENAKHCAVIVPSETVHLQEPDSVIRKRFVAPSATHDDTSEGSSQILLVKHRGKRHKLRKIVKKLICCSGSDSLSFHEGYMELPVASRDSAYYSPTQIPY